MGRERRLQMWADIEEEFGEPVADVIAGLREQGNSWRTVAGALEISRSTLQLWRKELALPLDQHDNVRDPSSTPEYTPTDIKARALGYDDARDAVIEMRLSRGLTLRQVAAELGVHPATVLRYTPRRLRGAIYNRSNYWWSQRRQWASNMLARWKAKYHGNHAWNLDNGMIFRVD